MKFLRDATNSILGDGLALLDSAPPHAKQRVIRSILHLLAPFQFALLHETNSAAIVDAVRIVTEAIVSTPYGQPLRFPAPLLITVGTSHVCPFACSNCYSDSGPDTQSSARFGRVELFQRIADSRTPLVMISGGEPLSVPNIHDLLETLLRARKFVYLATNAGINPIASMIADYKEHFFVLLSLWGTKETHDQQRGTGSYERIVRNLDQLNRLGSIGRLIVVLTSGDLAVLASVADLVKEFRIGSVVITRKLSVGRSDGSAIALTPDFAREIAARTRIIRPHVRKVFVDIPELRVLGARPASQRSRLRKLLGIPAGSECSAGNWMMHLDPSGVALPCYAFEGRAKIGLDSELSLQEQWRGISAFRKSVGGSAACIGEASVDERA